MNKAKDSGYALSKWKKHLGKPCPKCGKTVGVFYCVANRSKPKVVACVCGYRAALYSDGRMVEGKPKTSRKTVATVHLHRCRAITQKGTRCKRIAGPSGYCSIPSHRPGNSAV